MRRSQLRCIFLSLVFGAVIAGGAARALAGDVAVQSDAMRAVSSDITDEYIMIQLKDQPAASYEGSIKGLGRTRPLKGKFNPNSGPARAYLRYLDGAHGRYRAWLAQNAKGAEVVRDLKVSFNGIAVKLNGVPAVKAAGGPGVKAWAYSTVYWPAMNVSAGLIGADALWSASPADAGRGIAVAVIDSGIQDGHPFFACKGQNGIPAIRHHGPYYSGEAPGANNTAPAIVNTHGTHVAGTIGGCVCELGTVDPDGPVTGTISGVAPGVTLHDFNVFPGWGAATRTKNGGAFSHDIAAAIEDAVTIGVDVINMSLGGGVQGVHDYLAEVADAAVDAGVVVVAAAGNTGPGDSTVESPGSGSKVIAAGATSNPHFVGVPVTVGSNTYGAVQGEFPTFGTLTAAYTTVNPANGCLPLAENLTGKIALIDRGVCTFGTKVFNADTAGALGVLIVNSRAGDPIPMAVDPLFPAPTIPAAMLNKADGTAIKPSGTLTIDGTIEQEFITASADILADFSSWGPTPFTYLIKPDVMAPGVNVYSSVFAYGPGGVADIQYDFEMFQGTSMATPHVAGSAALLRARHPAWSPSDVRSALVNTAARVVTDTLTGTADPGVLKRGGGRVDLEAADVAPLSINPSTASFGFFSGNKDVSSIIALRIHNTDEGFWQSCTIGVTGPAIVTTSTNALGLLPGQTRTVWLLLNAGNSSSIGTGDYSGDVVITCGDKELKIPWLVRVNRNGKP